MEFLKDILGDELYAQVAEKLNGNDSIQLANIKDGKYIPVDKFNLERSNTKTLKGQIDELNGKLTAMQAEATASEALKAQLAQLTQTIAAKDAEMKAIRIDSAILDAARNARAKTPDIVARLIDRTKVAESETGFSGISEQFEALQKEYGYMFEPDPQQGRQGGFAGNQMPTMPSVGENSEMNNLIRASAGHTN